MITPKVKGNMKAVLADNQDAGAPELVELHAKDEAHPIEATGRELRNLFSWKTADDYTEGSVAR